MWQNDCVFHPDRKRISEIRHICSDLSALKGLSHSLLIDKSIAREIKEADTVLHPGDGIGIDHASGRIVARHVDRNIVALLIYIIQISCDMRSPREAPCRVNRKIWVIAEDIHLKVHSCVCHLNADRAETDHTELFISYLVSCKCFLSLLRSLADILIISIVFHPNSSADNIPGSQKKAGDGEFFYGVCICTRSVEDYYALLCTAVKRNIVHSGTCPCDCAKFRGELHILHIGRAHKNAGSLVDRVGDFIARTKLRKAYFTYVIQAEYFSIFH